jgi:hypothetical protein
VRQFVETARASLFDSTKLTRTRHSVEEADHAQFVVVKMSELRLTSATERVPTPHKSSENCMEHCVHLPARGQACTGWLRRVQ